MIGEMAHHGPENLFIAIMTLAGSFALMLAIKDADRIVVVTEEGITEQGRHRELVAAGGVYSRLHQAQFGQLA